MPRFFFDIHDGTDSIDREGTTLPTIGQARIEAAKYAGSLLAERAESFWTGDDWTLTVRDERSLALFGLTLFATDAAATRRGRRGPPAPLA